MSLPDCVDAAALERLYGIGGPALVGRMIDAFLAAAPARLAEGQAAAQAGDLEPLRRALHSLRSTAGNYGAAAVQELAERLGAAAAAGDAEALARELPLLDARMAELVARLELERRRCSP